MSEKELKDVLSTASEVTIGEKIYTIKPITLGDIAAFQKWCDKQKKKEIIEVYKMAGKEVNVRELISITGDEDYYNEMMNSLEGIIHLLYMGMSKTTKDITEQDIGNNLDTSKLQEIVELLFESFLEDKPEKKVEANPTPSQ